MSDSVKICSVGDLMLCDSPLYVSVGVGSKYQRIREKLIKNCKLQFNGADVVFGNFETVVYSPKNGSLKETQMACPTQAVEDLREMGFTILNLANNHSLQHGTEGFENTKKVCIKSGIEAIGIKDQEPLVVETKGKKLAFLSLCIHIEWYQPDNILYENRIKKILDDVKKLRNDNDSVIIIVSVHWGDEFAAYPSNAQIALAHTFVDYGANIILGHHAHVFQGIEEYKGAVIAYSQGNYISDMIPQMCRDTACLMIDISNNGINYTILPLYINNDFIPERRNANWYDERKQKMISAIKKQTDDNQYWKDIFYNHAIGHNNFVKYFKKNMRSYKKSVFLRMLFDFGARKIKRIIGTSSDGRVSSMDPFIMSEINVWKGNQKNITNHNESQ